MPWPYTYASKYPTAYKYSTIYGIYQGEKHINIDRHANLKYKYGSRSFWARGYYVDTVGRNKKVIAEYIRHQLDEGRMEDQISIKKYTDPFTGGQRK